MKKQNLNSNQSSFDSDFGSNSGKKVGAKDKSSKRRLSIYDDYEEDDEEIVSYEKFKSRHK